MIVTSYSSTDSGLAFPRGDSSNKDDKYKGKNNKSKKMSAKVRTWIKTVETNMWSKIHAVQTLMHFFQVCLSYGLMLVVMTYNSWLCLATVLGITAGYFLFGWRKTVVLQQSDNHETCH